MGQSREKLLGLAGWMSGNLVLGGGHLLTFSTYRVGAYLRWALIRGWALTKCYLGQVRSAQSAVCIFQCPLQDRALSQAFSMFIFGTQHQLFALLVLEEAHVYLQSFF